MDIATKVVFAVRLAVLVLLYGTWSFYHWDFDPSGWGERSRMWMITAFVVFCILVPVNYTVTDNKDQS